jgi:hypothetical protein
MRTAETIRMTPSTSLSAAAGIRPIEEAPEHRPDHRPHTHRCDRLREVIAVLEGAEPAVPEHPHGHGRQRDQEARRSRRLDAGPKREDERGDCQLAAGDPEQAANQPDAEPEDHRRDDTDRERVGQKPRHVLGQERLHDQRRADHHQEHENDPLQQALGEAVD